MKKMKTFKTIKLIFFIMFITFHSTIARDYPPGGGGGGEWVKFKNVVSAEDPAGNPMSGVEFRMTATHWLYEFGGWNAHTVTETGHTDAYGAVTL